MNVVFEAISLSPCVKTKWFYFHCQNNIRVDRVEARLKLSCKPTILVSIIIVNLIIFLIHYGLITNISHRINLHIVRRVSRCGSLSFALYRSTHRSPCKGTLIKHIAILKEIAQETEMQYVFN